MEAAVKVDQLTRSFRVAERTVGLKSTVKGVFHRKHKVADAVQDVTFQAAAGEILGVLGPNGSGKTTMLKCVAGLLTPTSGTVEALGFTPHRRSHAFLRRIGFIMGQRTQIHPDVSVFDSLELRRVIYELTDQQFEESKEELVTLLGLDEFGDAPVRQLSLGQRMRCELAAALLHQPDLVLLDEPTIGLDFEAQDAIRAFVQRYVARHDACVLLTSHYLADIEALAGRVVVLAKGRLVFEGSLGDLRRMGSDSQVITLTHEGGIGLAEVQAVAGPDAAVTATPGAFEVSAPRAEVPKILAALGGLPGVTGLSLTAPPLEDALAQLYAEEDSDVG
jgi:ABC-2 type transport system ATP-binding protein